MGLFKLLLNFNVRAFVFQLAPVTVFISKKSFNELKNPRQLSGSLYSPQ